MEPMPHRRATCFNNTTSQNPAQPECTNGHSGRTKWHIYLSNGHFPRTKWSFSGRMVHIPDERALWHCHSPVHALPIAIGTNSHPCPCPHRFSRPCPCPNRFPRPCRCPHRFAPTVFPPRMGRLLVARGGSLGCSIVSKVCGPPWRAAYEKNLTHGLLPIPKLQRKFPIGSWTTSHYILALAMTHTQPSS